MWACWITWMSMSGSSSSLVNGQVVKKWVGTHLDGGDGEAGEDKQRPYDSAARRSVAEDGAHSRDGHFGHGLLLLFDSSQRSPHGCQLQQLDHFVQRSATCWREHLRCSIRLEVRCSRRFHHHRRLAHLLSIHRSCKWNSMVSLVDFGSEWMEGEARGVAGSEEFALDLVHCWVASGSHVLNDPEWTRLDQRLAADPVVVDAGTPLSRRRLLLGGRTHCSSIVIRFTDSRSSGCGSSHRISSGDSLSLSFIPAAMFYCLSIVPMFTQVGEDAVVVYRWAQSTLAIDR